MLAYSLTVSGSSSILRKISNTWLSSFSHFIARVSHPSLPSWIRFRQRYWLSTLSFIFFRPICILHPHLAQRSTPFKRGTLYFSVLSNTFLCRRSCAASHFSADMNGSCFPMHTIQLECGCTDPLFGDVLLVRPYSIIPWVPSHASRGELSIWHPRAEK